MPVVSSLRGGPLGPAHQGRWVQGRYFYWTVMVLPTQAVVASHGLTTPDTFTREQFGKLLVKVHKECGVARVGTACALEPHANGLMRLNCLVRADAQYRWKQIGAQAMRLMLLPAPVRSAVFANVAADTLLTMI